MPSSPLAEADDVLGRAEGEPLWPERCPAQALAEIRESIGPYWWSALYQQVPAPPEGALFRGEWWRYWETLPAVKEMLLSVDCSFKEGKDTSYVVVQCWGRTEGRAYLLDQWRQRADFVATLEAIQAMAARWPAARLKLIEDKANGPAVVSSLQRKMPGVVAVNPQGGKLSRAQAALPFVEQGRVWLPMPELHPWVLDFLAEAAAFPVSRHLDQIDSMTQALQYWIGLRDRVPSNPRPAPKSPIERQIESMMRGDTPGPWIRPTTPVSRRGWDA